MSEKYIGGFITLNPTQPTGGVNGSAPGVWTVDQALQYNKAGLWPTQPGPAFEVSYQETSNLTYTPNAYTIYPANALSRFAVAFDSLGNYYQTYYNNGFYSICCVTSNQPFFQYVKFDKNIVYQSSYGKIPTIGGGGDAAVLPNQTALSIDSSNNLYSLTRNSVAYPRISLIKYNSSGAAVWGVYIAEVTSTYASLWGAFLNLDASLNSYITTSRVGSSILVCCVAIYPIVTYLTKYNSSGTRQWTVSTNAGLTSGTAVDTSGNIWAVINKNPQQQFFNGGPNSQIGLLKVNTAGTFGSGNFPSAWQNVGAMGEGIAIDSSNNIYVFVNINASTSNFVKFNSSGAIQWGRTFSTSGPQGGGAVALDSSGNVYFAWYSSGPTYVVKYNSSGVIQWQRTLTGATYTSLANFSIGPDNFLYIAGNLNSGTISGGSFSNPITVTKLPSDGSKTGTYSITSTGGSTYSFTWAASSATDSALTISDSSGTVTVTTITPADASTASTSSVTTTQTYDQRLIL
jgi:hypothetical protein